MAEEPQNPAASEVVVSDVPPPSVEDDKSATPEPEPVPEETAPPAADTEESTFKEESNVVSELPEPQRKALDELKKLIQEALNKHEFTPPPPPPPPAKEEEKVTEETVAAVDAEEAVKVEETETAKVEETEVAKVEEAVVEKKEEEAVVVVEEVKTEEVVTASGEEKVEEEEKTVEAIEETIVSVTAAAAVPEVPEAEKEEVPAPEEVFLWGIPLLGDDRSDVILLKFLRARDFKVKESLAMIKKCVKWRKEFGVDSLLEEDLGGSDYNKVVFAHGFDKEAHPVVYNVFGEFKDKELYQSTFGDADKQNNFLKWLVQFLERTIRKLDFSPTGVSSFVLVNDLKNSPGYGKREFYKIINKYFALLQDNYPEFVAKQVCINTSWWYLAYSWVYISVFTPRSRSKFVFASSSKAAETLFRYISPEQVPVQYGGHSKVGDESEFTVEDAVTEVSIKPSSKHSVELSFKEPCSVVWEVRVVGWDVSYEAQFVPEQGYTVLVAKPRKVGPTDEPIIADSFKILEPGKLVLTIDNHSSKKKKLLYRSKVKVSE